MISITKATATIQIDPALNREGLPAFRVTINAGTQVFTRNLYKKEDALGWLKRTATEFNLAVSVVSFRVCGGKSWQEAA